MALHRETGFLLLGIVLVLGISIGIVSAGPASPDQTLLAPSGSNYGTLYVASYPTGATILINGIDSGTTNKVVSGVPAGNLNLTLIKDGYRPYTTVVSVPTGDLKVLAPITLVKGGGASAGIGKLYVASTPSGATILINGTDFGTTNKLVSGVPAGNLNLTLIKDGYRPYTTVVSVPAGDLKVLAPITLSRLEDSPGLPGMPGLEWPSGFGNFEAYTNARGIYYNDQIYVFSLWYKGAELWNDKNYGIQLRYFKDNTLSGSYGMWGGSSKAELAPLVVKVPNGSELMFIFVTGENGNIYFTRVNGNDWPDDDWLKIRDSTTGQYITTNENGWEVAPVFNPTTQRITVYYAKNYNDYLYRVYTDDYGNTWRSGGKVNNSPTVKSAPGAVYYTPWGNNSDVLLSVKDVNQKIRVCYLQDGTNVSSVVLPTPASDNINGYGRPFLIDLGPNIALMYAAEHGDKTYCSDWYIPHIMVFNKTTQQWGESYQAFYLPELGAAQGTFQFHHQPNAAFDSKSNTFYLFYGYELCAMYTDQTNNGPWWKFIPIKTPGT